MSAGDTPAARHLPGEVAGPAVPWSDRPGLYVRTARHLRPRQLAYQVYRRLLPPRPPRMAPPLGPLRFGSPGGAPLTPFLATPAGDSTGVAIRFLRALHVLDPAAPDWSAAALPKLWRYNLHYFDYLQWQAIPSATKDALIDSWIAAVPPGAADAWEPYPLSLRIVNWLKYWSSRGDVPAAWQASLDLQVAALARAVEYHLLANHLLKNGKALLFAGLCGTGPAAASCRELGLAITLAEVAEQILPDGGHIERSPMYHAIALEDLLDLLNLLRALPELVPAARAPLAAAAGRAADWLAAMRTGHGEIPLFNDAAFGIAPPTDELLAYAGRVLGVAPPGGDGLIQRPDSGYFGYRAGGDSLVIDCGPVGPDYQPGHAHCDTLAYELCVDGRPIVVDSGTHDYEAGPLRRYLRSTAAHSTVRVDGADQSEVWGAFRVGRRARARLVGFETRADGGFRFAGEHDGYRHLPGRPVHHRQVDVAPGRRWAVQDVVRGDPGRNHRVETFVHLHPAVVAERTGSREFLLRAEGGLALRFRAGATGELYLASGYYCPGFGCRLASGALVLDYTGPLPATLDYVIERP